MKQQFAVFLAILLAGTFFGCGTQSQHTNRLSGSSSGSSVPSINTITFSSRDSDASYDPSTATHIRFNCTTSATIEGAGAYAQGNTVTIEQEGVYILSGTSEAAQVVVNAPKTAKLQLVLDGIDLKNTSAAPLYIAQADKVFLTLAQGSQNYLQNTSVFTLVEENNVDAVIFSKEDLTINGEGQLIITTEYGNGITSKDDLTITGGNLTVTATHHGLEAKDALKISGGSFAITSGKDALHCENNDDISLGSIYLIGGNYTLNATGDGISASKNLEITGGEYAITTGGGSTNSSTNTGWGAWYSNNPVQTEDNTSAKGLKATDQLIISGGNFIIDSSDDALHANNDVVVTGGDFTITSGDDGVHADSNVTIDGGEIRISICYEGIEGQSIDIRSGTISIIARDDGLNAAGGNDQSALGNRPGRGTFTVDENAYIHISGGNIVIQADGDGIDSNGTLTISGGNTYITGPTNNGNGAIDANGDLTITGGIIIATGPRGMAQNFGNTSTQPAIMINLNTSQTGEIVLLDSAKQNLAQYTPTRSYDNVVISAPSLTVGKTYIIQAGNETHEITLQEIITGASNGFTPGNEGFVNGGRPGRHDWGNTMLPEDAPIPPEGTPTPPNAARPHGTVPTQPQT